MKKICDVKTAAAVKNLHNLLNYVNSLQLTEQLLQTDSNWLKRVDSNWQTENIWLNQLTEFQAVDLGIINSDTVWKKSTIS